jgi:hypothetical protein
MFSNENIQEIIRIMGEEKVLSICAGFGLVEDIFKQAGVNIVATDKKNEMKSKFIVEMDAITAVREYKDCNILYVSWLPYKCGPWASIALRNFIKLRDNPKIIVVGESRGMSCADDEFFNVLDSLNEEHCIVTPNWRGVLGTNSSITVYTKKK